MVFSFLLLSSEKNTICVDMILKIFYNQATTQDLDILFYIAVFCISFRTFTCIIRIIFRMSILFCIFFRSKRY
nr:MAG TPA: hypothetical protein [Caudoviricetes sp.]